MNVVKNIVTSVLLVLMFVVLIIPSKDAVTVENKENGIRFHPFMASRRGKYGSSDRFLLLGL